MVISTELVSLNIHEALTFDGTEVCLHPDLFGSLSNRVSGAKSTNVNNVDSNFSVSHSMLGATIPITNRTLSFDDRSTVYNTPSLMPSGSNLSGNSTAIATNSTTPNINVLPTGSGNISPLKPGDLIEIRVWDPISGGVRNSAGVGKVSSISASSIIRPRKTTSGNTIISSVTNHLNISESKRALNQRSIQSGRDVENNQEEEKFAVRARAESAVTTNSLQYSMKSDGDDDLAIALMTPNIYLTSSKDSTGFTSQSNDNLSLSSESAPSRQDVNGIPSSSALPPPRSLETTLQSVEIPATKTASNVLPPVFPRGRTNTGDNNTFANVITTRLVSKRPTPVQRRATSGAAPFDTVNTIDTKTNTVTAPITAISTLASQQSRHHRDISDMTTETLAGVAISTSPPPDVSTESSNVRMVVAHATKGYAPLHSGPTLSQVDDEDESMTHLSNTHTLRLAFVMLVTEKSLSSLKGTARTQISLLRQVADLYQLSNYDMVTINKVESFEEEEVLNAVSAHFLLVTIKNQFISRGDMHYFQNCLNGSWVYEGQRLHESSRGFQAIARGVRHSDKQVKSGIVTDKTTVTFRSRSARIFWLVQMSSEMWEYSSPYGFVKGDEGVCEIYFDKWIAFIHELFVKWKEVEATHSLTVIFFSRTFLGSDATTNSVLLKKDIYGRLYEDHFRPVVENFMGPDWDSVVRTIKEAFVSYPYDVAWNLHTDETFRRPSSASQGNVLEAINVTLNLLQFHYLDRDLHRTGNSLVLVSAGNGVFEVDRGLAGVSYQVHFIWNFLYRFSHQALMFFFGNFNRE
jgi:Vacuolar membrane-associated protein Iml1